MVRAIFVVLLSGFGVFIGCERKPADQTPGAVTSEDVRRDVGQAVDTAAEFSQQKKEEFQTSLGARLQEMDTRIAELREKGRDLKDQAKVNWDQKMADLEAKREAARVKLTEVGQSSAEAWRDVQRGAQSAWDELERAVQDASNEFAR
jgi:TolA-binding protein